MVNQKAEIRYGKYIYPILFCGDLLLINIVFVLTSHLLCIDDNIQRRIIWLVMIVSYFPTIPFTSDEQRVSRTIHINRIVLGSLKATLIHALFFISLLAITNIEVPAKFFLEFYAILIVLLLLWWLCSRKIIKFYRGHGTNFVTVIIVGTNPTALRLYQEFQSDVGYGYKFMGFFGDDCPQGFPDKYVGGISRIDAFVKENDIDEIYYAQSGENDDALMAVSQIADDNVVPFYYVPQISNYVGGRFETCNVGSLPVLSLNTYPLQKPVNAAIKRIFDLLFSSVLLILSPLVFIPVAVAIKISSPGPVFFKQERTGYRGKSFVCWKFRTMRVNPDSDNLEAGKEDSRKTRVGEFLRHTSIDELPQFVNVFLGEMSVVGPRPHMLKHTVEYNKLINKYMVRHFIKPGITGWAQVNGYRGATAELWKMERRVEYDVWYIKNWDFLLDVKIIFKTIVNIFRGEENAY